MINHHASAIPFIAFLAVLILNSISSKLCMLNPFLLNSLFHKIGYVFMIPPLLQYLPLLLHMSHSFFLCFFIYIYIFSKSRFLIIVCSNTLVFFFGFFAFLVLSMLTNSVKMKPHGFLVPSLFSFFFELGLDT